MAKRTEIDKMVSQSQLQEDFEAIIEANPEHIVVGYINPETNTVIIKWYGTWVSCKGINDILEFDLFEWIKEKNA